MLLVLCHPSVRKTRQSSLTRNSDVHTMFLAKITAVDPRTGVALHVNSGEYGKFVYMSLELIVHTARAHMNALQSGRLYFG